LVTAILWTVALIVDSGPFAQHSVLLIGVGLLGCAVVAAVGLVIVGARWAHRLGWYVVIFTVVLAVLRPVDGIWIVAAASSLAAAIGLVVVVSRLRQLPPATGPGDRPVLLPLVLLATPTALGLVVPGPAPVTLALGLSAPLAGFLYARVIWGGLAAVRMGWPLLAVALTPFLVWPGPVASIPLAVLVAAIAWHPSVKAAFHPPRETGSAMPIPPELTPKAIRDAAGIDDRGQPR
jgi:hypothetical protein